MMTCVVLAAGTSSRFGESKLITPIDGETLLARAVRACGTFPFVVVTNAQTMQYLNRFDVDVIENDRPELGMTHSLQLAHAHIAATHAIAVLPADLALIEPSDVAYVVAACSGVDVTYPRRSDGRPGHPVVFSAHARTGIEALAPGDTIKQLRDRQDLTHRVLVIDEPWPYLDVDRKGDLVRVRAAKR